MSYEGTGKETAEMNLQPARPRHTFLRVAARFISGRPLDGAHRTNSTFLQRADKDISPRGRASRWHHLPGYHRSAWRMGTLTAVTAFLYGLAYHALLTISATCTAAVTALAYGIWRARRAIRMLGHNRSLVQPLYQTLAPMVGHPYRDIPSRYLSVPLDYRDNENASIRLTLPPTWEGKLAQQKDVSSLVIRRLGGDWDSFFNHTVKPPYVDFRRSPAPPSSVAFSDIRAAYDSGSANTLILGIGARNDVISVSLDSDSPHFALSIGTGGGKSSVGRGIIAYLIHHGVERIDIVDPKRVSQNWARGIPGVYIHRTMATQMEAIHSVRERMDSRYDSLDSDETLTFPRHVLLIEEQNSWISYAQQYWDDYRRDLDPPERAKVPRKNPALGDLAYILFQGRQACVNVFSIYQRMSAAASGGGDLRENYGAKLLARFSPQTWKILVGTTPVPRSSRIAGRAMFVLGDEHRAVQLAFLTEPEARAYALAGCRAPAPDDGGSPLLSALPVAGSGMTLDEELELLSLREISESGVVPIRYGALLKARQRDPEFPAGIYRGPVALYRPDDVQRWEANRLRRAR